MKIKVETKNGKVYTCDNVVNQGFEPQQQSNHPSFYTITTRDSTITIATDEIVTIIKSDT